MKVDRPIVPVTIPLAGAVIHGDLSLPDAAKGLVVFAHGSGSSRASPRNRAVAGFMNDAGLATLLLDLLTADEDAEDRMTAAWRFDVRLLGRRVHEAARWVAGEPRLEHLPLGYFGASTGAAAALIAAAEPGSTVRAVVSRGGRPDLAGEALPRVAAPTLLIVGGLDGQVIELNEQALAQLNPESRLVIVPGATHLFEEPGKLEQVAELARKWLVDRLVGPAHEGARPAR
jgi:dienelactone hydrolase